ncbi:MAG: pyruvate, phosphate dikinase [Anaerolineales bacterium]|nr:pyruvate, phosphate dikinase [Anaerolineales bacterium]
MSNNKWIYLFSDVDQAEKHAGSWEATRALLGGKGANLGEMTRIGVPVPPGFTASTEACNAYLEAGEQFPEGMWDQEVAAMAAVEKQTDKKFGDPKNPLLVSCRSGAKFSMPGMMDTVLNIGLNDEVAESMIAMIDDARFVYDAYRRLVHMFGSVVLNIDDEAFEEPLDEYKKEKGYKLDTEMTAEDWKKLTETYKAVIKEQMGFEFPQDPYEQLKLATEAVFKSWNGRRAINYRNAAGIAHDLGTGVNIQTMVFGNMDKSGTGVAFTRNPATGEKKLYGDYLENAQGEDVVAGIRNAEDITTMQATFPKAYADFLEVCDKLEDHYKEMQDVEFTVEHEKLWMLQTRDGKRTAKAAVTIAVDMANEGLISREDAVKRVTPEQVDTLLHPQFIDEAKKKAQETGSFLVSGVNASPGAAVGRVYFDADTAEEKSKEDGQDVIMVRPFTKPDDVHGMLAAKGILTTEGGATSHAAVVARQFGIPCVVGASAARINLETRTLTVGDLVVKEGDWISVDGTSGESFLGRIESVAPSLEEQTDLLELLGWADELTASEGVREFAEGWPTRGLQVWANADYPEDARRARSYGAQGIGLCRTEHMFFEPERLPIVQDMILAGDNVEVRQAALDKLLPYQRQDFDGLFEAMTGLPVIIRLIDPPLHEFMPDERELLEAVIEARVKGETLPEKEALLEDIEALHESNPMMGLRGVRLSVMMPEIVSMQVRAIFEAAADVKLRGFEPKPEVMIPLTGHVNELLFIQPKLEEIAADVMKTKGVEFDYKFGTMIEIPRAGLTADQIAETAEFFSFGTNDLTQFTFGYSRDDAERNFLVKYVEDGILEMNPFQTIDRAGVGQLMKLTVEKGRATRTDLECGICGEHGGDPNSIEWCHLIGLNYVSCSPFRVPIARLAAAHAALTHKK